MKAAKLTLLEARVLQALRAAPMDSNELSDRFPGGYPIGKLLKLGHVEQGAHGYQLTQAGRLACPSRRSIEIPKDLPPLIQAKAVKPPTVPTIGLYSALKPEPVQESQVMPPQPKINKTAEMRRIINEYPGVEHDALVRWITGNSTDADVIKKANWSINTALKKGNFRLVKAEQVGTGKLVKTYYTNDDFTKQHKKAKKMIENTIPTLAQHHAAEKFEATHESVANDTPELKFINDDQVANAGKPLVTEPLQVQNVAVFGAYSAENDKEAYLPIQKKQSALQVQEGGDHYKRMKIQPVQYIMANDIGFIEGSVIKYVSRWKNKNGLQDLKKARHFLDILIEQESAV